MKTAYFLLEHHACHEGARWALSVSKDMADVWDSLVEQKKHAWLMWMLSQSSVFPDSTLRRLACRFVRETPLADGRTVWDLLTDERSRKAVEVAERYVDGKATDDELAAAAWAAYSAADAAFSDAYADYPAYAARAAARAADAAAHAARAAYVARAADTDPDAADADPDAAASAAAYAAAKSAQVKMIAELGNPFKKRSDK